MDEQSLRNKQYKHQVTSTPVYKLHGLPFDLYAELFGCGIRTIDDLASKTPFELAFEYNLDKNQINRIRDVLNKNELSFLDIAQSWRNNRQKKKRRSFVARPNLFPIRELVFHDDPSQTNIRNLDKGIRELFKRHGIDITVYAGAATVPAQGTRVIADALFAMIRKLEVK